MSFLTRRDLLALTLANLTDEGLLVTPSKSSRSTGKRLLFEWTPELQETVDEAKRLRGAIRSLWLICSRQGQRYTSSGFRAMWRRVLDEALASHAIPERYTFHDLRAKAGSDSDDGRLLGHQDPKTFERHYQRKPIRIKPREVS